MSRSVLAMGDEPGILEDTQVLGDGGTAYRKVACELADLTRTGAQELEDVPSRRVAERIQRMSVSRHLP